MNDIVVDEQRIIRERALSHARMFFALAVLMLQAAVWYEKTPILDKWWPGGFAIAFLIWSMILFSAAWVKTGNFSRIIEETYTPSMTLALVPVGYGLFQGMLSVIQANLGVYYFWFIAIMGTIFYLTLAIYQVVQLYKYFTNIIKAKNTSH